MNADVPIALGAKVPNSGPLPQRPGIPAMAAALEKAGFESLWVSDHVVMPAEIHSVYPFAADGRATWPTDTPYYDAIVAMTLIAAATTTARIGPAVLVLPQREPVVLAKQLASLDALSQGRVELGIGAGWLAEEFAALDVPFESRGSRFVEWIALLRACWTGSPEAHLGRHYDLPAGVLTRPAPAHRIPLYVGGHSPVALRRAATLADGWLAQQSVPAIDPAELAAGRRAMAEAAERAGVDPAGLRVVLRLVESAGRCAEVARALPDLAAAGVDEIIVDADWERPDGAAEAYAALKTA
jgi:probable F420-dependent oxidoreductase